MLYINALLEQQRTTDTQQTNMAAQSDPPVPSVFISHSAYFCHHVKLLIKKKEKNERNILCIFFCSICFFSSAVSVGLTTTNCSRPRLLLSSALKQQRHAPFILLFSTLALPPHTHTHIHKPLPTIVTPHQLSKRSCLLRTDHRGALSSAFFLD